MTSTLVRFTLSRQDAKFFEDKKDNMGQLFPLTVALEAATARKTIQCITRRAATYRKINTFFINQIINNLNTNEYEDTIYRGQ